MARRIVLALIVIVAMVSVAVFARWRIGLVNRASGTFGDTRMVFELREHEDGVYLHTHGAGTSVRFIAELKKGNGVQSELNIDETTGTVVVSYGNVLQRFTVDNEGSVAPTE